MNPYAIKGIPNSDNGNKSRAQLKDTEHYVYKTQGRGHRFRAYAFWDQSLPLPMAAHMTLYGYVKDGVYADGHPKTKSWPKDYWRYMGRKNGKPVIRQMTHDYPVNGLLEKRG